MRKIILLALFLLLVVMAFNSYGTGDVKFWFSWALAFTSSGFWESLFVFSDIPYLTTLWVYFSAVAAKSIFGVVNEQTFPFIMKTLLVPFLFLCPYLLQKIIKRSDLYTFFIFILNPAILLNLVILGYMDVIFVSAFFLCLYFLYKIESNDKPLWLFPMLFFATFVIGFFTKPQWIMFMPVLGTMGVIVSFRKKLLKAIFPGIVMGLSLIALTVLAGASSSFEVVNRFTQIKTVLERIANQVFVVANFPNFWQLVNYLLHTCRLECSVKQFATGVCFQGCSPADYYYGFFKPLLYWTDSFIAIPGKLLFIFAFFFYGFFLIRDIISRKKDLGKSWPIRTTLVLALWTNIVYAFFNTSVHENHLIATVYFSAALLSIKPNLRSLFLYVFFTVFNFLNLFYYYGFGISGLFGFFALGEGVFDKRLYFTIGGLNIAMILTVVYFVFLGILTYKLIRNQDFLSPTKF